MTPKKKASGPKPVKAWAVVSPTNGILGHSVENSREESWRKVGINQEVLYQYRKAGYRCIRVLITPA